VARAARASSIVRPPFTPIHPVVGSSAMDEDQRSRSRTVEKLRAVGGSLLDGLDFSDVPRQLLCVAYIGTSAVGVAALAIAGLGFWRSLGGGSALLGFSGTFIASYLWTTRPPFRSWYQRHWGTPGSK
jgi:hypothetical protein